MSSEVAPLPRADERSAGDLIDRVLGVAERSVETVEKGPPAARRGVLVLTGFALLLGFVWVGWLAPWNRGAAAAGVPAAAPPMPVGPDIQRLGEKVDGMREDVKGLREDVRVQSQRIDRVYELVTKPGGGR